MTTQEPQSPRLPRAQVDNKLRNASELAMDLEKTRKDLVDCRILGLFQAQAIALIDRVIAAESELKALREQPITKEMVFAFCHAISDGAVGEDEFQDVKRGLEAAFGHLDRPRQMDAAAPQPEVAAPELQQEKSTNYCALNSITDDQVRKVVRAFWRRIYAYRNDYGIELPSPLPVEFMAHMATALSWVDSSPAPQPEVAAPGEILSIGMDQPWSMYHCVKQLVNAADILLYERGFDGHGHEIIREAKVCAEKHLHDFMQSTAPKAQSDWQPIETAPKDPAINFLAYETGVGVQITSWWPEHDEGLGGYRTHRHGWNPSHWMPLPVRPAIAIAEGGE